MKTVSFLLIAILLIGTAAYFNIQPVRAEGTIYIRADGSIDPATAPIVRSGDVYVIVDDINGSIVIQRNNMTLDGAGFTIQGGGAEHGIDLLQICNVTIKDIVILGGCHSGIYLDGSSSINLHGNYVRNTSWGAGIGLTNSSNSRVFDNDLDTMVYCEGIYAYYSSNNSIFSNRISNVGPGSGILVSSSSNNNISYNDVTLSNFGINIEESSSNELSNNSVIGNLCWGIGVTSSFNNTISTNTITANGDYGVSLAGGSNNVVSGNNITGHAYEGIEIYGRSSDNSIIYNDIHDNGNTGILNICSNNTQITGNNITNNFNGIEIWASANATVARNSITANYACGVGFQNSTGRHFIFHNNFLDNTNQVYNLYSVTVDAWNDSYPSGGNYWSDLNPTDTYSGPYQNETGRDKIGDTPYIIDENNTDNYPLIYPYGYVPTHDFNNDGKINIFDLVRIALAYGSVPGMPNWDPYVDLNQDGIIDIFDLVIVAVHFGETS